MSDELELALSPPYDDEDTSMRKKLTGPKVKPSPFVGRKFLGIKSLFYYIARNMGMTSSGSFSRDRSRWITFTQEDIDRFAGHPPYGSTHAGAFISTDQFSATKTLSNYQTKAGTCKQGERSDLTGCTPASGQAGQKPRGKPKPSSSERYRDEDEQFENYMDEQEERGEFEEEMMEEDEDEIFERYMEEEEERYEKEKKYAPPPEGESIVEPPCCLHDPDPHEIDPKTGVTKASRVGVVPMSVPPPPKEIPRLPNLTEKERAAEARFADTYLEYPDEMVAHYTQLLKDGKIGDGPNFFSTDDAKLLSSDYNPETGDDTEKKAARGIYNAAVHQTANALAKRAFITYLDNVVSNLPEGQRSVLVTSGGVAAGKGFALKNVDATKDLVSQMGAIWDAAGEQNANENPWVLEECKKRGIKPTFVFVHADPHSRWENPKSGVIERANNIGRMVDARLYADSYAIGAKNFKAFYDKHQGEAEFLFLDNSGPKPVLMDSIPDHALDMDADQLYSKVSNVLKEKSGQVNPWVDRGGRIGERLWGQPDDYEDEGWGE